jgi:carbon-monoxide dehydrogenase large subunit
VLHLVQLCLAEALRLPAARVRVLADQLGGGFGTKSHVYPEDVLAALLSIQIGRPVKWIEDRREHFLAAVHAREQVHEVTVGVRHDGRLVAVEDRVLADIGARVDGATMAAPYKTAASLPGPYRLEHYHCEVLGVVTNKTPAGAYRGMGAPEATFVVERLVDLVAARLDLDPLEVRQRNMIQPGEMPFTSASGWVYDSGDYLAGLRKAADLAGYADLRARQRDGWAKGRYLGIGLAAYVEATGVPGIVLEPSAGDRDAVVEFETVRLHLDQAGHATLYTALMPMGQGLETALSQVVADELGVSPPDVRVVYGDTSLTPFGPNGSIGSRSIVMGGGAARAAGERLQAKLRRLAAHVLEAAPEDLMFAGDRFALKDTPGRGISVRELAAIAHAPSRLPPGEEVGLDASGTYRPRGRVFAYGAHVAVVEVLPATGETRILQYTVVDDCGTVVNPTIVEGQMHGGVAQGIAGALFEELVYDASGQLVTANLMDYLVPTSVEVPSLVLGHLATSPPATPGPMKGVGETGTLGPPAAVANAVADALRPLGVQVYETPITPARLWAAIHATSG